MTAISPRPAASTFTRTHASAAPDDAGRQTQLREKEELVRELESRQQAESDDYRQARENVDVTREAYEEKVSDLTKMAFEAHH